MKTRFRYTKAYYSAVKKNNFKKLLTQRQMERTEKNYSGQGHHNTERKTSYTISLDICASWKIRIEGRKLVSSHGERFHAKGNRT